MASMSLALMDYITKVYCENRGWRKNAGRCEKKAGTVWKESRERKEGLGGKRQGRKMLDCR